METELPDRLYGRRNGISKTNAEALEKENKDQYMDACMPVEQCTATYEKVL